MAFAGSQARAARAMTQPMEAAFQSVGIGVSIGNRCNVASTLFAVADSSTKMCWRKSLSRHLLRGSPRTRPVFRLGTLGVCASTAPRQEGEVRVVEEASLKGLVLG